MSTVDWLLEENAQQDKTDINAQNMRKLGQPGQTLRALIKAGEDEALVIAAFANISPTKTNWRSLKVFTPALVCSMVHSSPDYWFVKWNGTAA
jgi:hypothetical protein